MSFPNTVFSNRFKNTFKMYAIKRPRINELTALKSTPPTFETASNLNSTKISPTAKAAMAMPGFT